MNKSLMNITPNRWVADIEYEGGISVTHYMNELIELHNIVERGPNFYLINKIEVHANNEREGYRECRADAIEQNDIPNVSGLIK